MSSAPAPAPSAPVAPESRTGLPPWGRGQLPATPVRRWRDWLGPGIVMAGASLGAGEWLIGPAVTARYGGSLLWIALVTLLAQYLYNVEASRYTLATGESIMTGKLRVRPGSRFWTIFYMLFDIWSLLPYQISAVAVTLGAVWLARMPDPTTEMTFLRGMTYVALILVPIPLLFGGKVYRTLKQLISFKVFAVLGFMLVMSLWLATWDVVLEVASGFLKFGSLPLTEGGTANVFVSWWRGEPMPHLDRESLKLLTTLAAIAGVGGLSQASVCAYTREQGWGMGGQVGAIPSLVGGKDIAMAHTGVSFTADAESMPRWRAWLRFVRLDQWRVWLPASLIGLALPAIVSCAILPRGTVADRWVLAGMMAGGVEERIGGVLGHAMFFGMLLCGFLVLLPSSISSVDGFLRRWVDISWTSFHSLQKLDPHKVRWIYYGLLVFWFVFAAVFLSFSNPLWLVVVAGNVGNFALGISTWHTLAINVTLLPPPLRPSWPTRIGMFFAGLYFLSLAVLTLFLALGW